MGIKTVLHKPISPFFPATPFLLVASIFCFALSFTLTSLVPSLPPKLCLKACPPLPSTNTYILVDPTNVAIDGPCYFHLTEPKQLKKLDNGLGSEIKLISLFIFLFLSPSLLQPITKNMLLPFVYSLLFLPLPRPFSNSYCCSPTHLPHGLVHIGVESYERAC